MRTVPVRFRAWRRSLLGVALLAFVVPLVALGATSKTVDVLVSSYSPAAFSVEAGTTVTFRNTSALPHTATAEDSSFDTGMIAAGTSKSVTLNRIGTYAFYCQYHGAVGGVGQSGVITVTAAAGATVAPTQPPGNLSGVSGPGPTAPPTAALAGGSEGNFALFAFAGAAAVSLILAVLLDLLRRAAPEPEA